MMLIPPFIRVCLGAYDPAPMPWLPLGTLTGETAVRCRYGTYRATPEGPGAVRARLKVNLTRGGLSQPPSYQM